MSQEVSSFDGAYYQVNGMRTEPRPVQRPRPPIMIAAMGPKMLKHAAKHADVWNSLSFKANFEEQLEETAARTQQMRSNCTEIGRDPDDIRWSFTLFEPDSRQRGGAFSYYESPDTFVRKVSALRELGMSEISMYYPFLESQVAVFEEIARDVLPELKAT